MRPGPPIRPMLQHAGTPREDDGAETLHSDDVHPLIQIDLRAIQVVERGDDLGDDEVDGGFVAEEGGGCEEGADEAPLEAVAGCVALGEEVEGVGG